MTLQRGLSAIAELLVLLVIQILLWTKARFDHQSRTATDRSDHIQLFMSIPEAIFFGGDEGLVLFVLFKREWDSKPTAVRSNVTY